MNQPSVGEWDSSAASSADDEEQFADPVTGERLTNAELLARMPSSLTPTQCVERKRLQNIVNSAAARERKKAARPETVAVPKATKAEAAPRAPKGRAPQLTAVQEKAARNLADTAMGLVVGWQIKYPSMPRLNNKQLEAVIVPAARLYVRNGPPIDADTIGKVASPNVLDVLRLARGAYMVASDYGRVPDPVALFSAFNPFGRKPRQPTASQPAPAASNGYAPPAAGEVPPTGEEALQSLFVAASRNGS